MCIQNEVTHTTGNYNDKQALTKDLKNLRNYLKWVIDNFPPTNSISTISATLTEHILGAFKVIK